MKSMLLALTMAFVGAAQSFAGYVQLDDFSDTQSLNKFSPGPVTGSATTVTWGNTLDGFPNAFGTSPIAGASRTLSLSSFGTISIGASSATFSLGAGTTATVAYTSIPAGAFTAITDGGGGKWLATLVTSAIESGSDFTVSMSVPGANPGFTQTVSNISTTQPVKLNLFAAGIGPGWNALTFTITNNSVSDKFISFSELSATPEPASMLTAGCFALVGGIVYRRRRAKLSVKS